METKKLKPTHMKSALIEKFVIVRTYSAGIHAGVLVAKKGKEVRLQDAHRIWSWTQAETNTGSLSAVSQYGVGVGSRVTNSVPMIELTEAIEVIECSARAISSIRGGKWT